MRNKALKKALKTRGDLAKLAAALNITSQAISQWDEVPAAKIIAVERVTGIPREELRPDLYRRPASIARLSAGGGR